MGLFDDIGSLFGGSVASPGVAPMPAAGGSDILGGLMGTGPLIQNDTLRNTVGALGQSIMTSPSNNMLQNFSSSYKGLEANDSGKQALIKALKALGMSDDQILQYMNSPGQGQSGLGGLAGFPGGSAAAPLTMPSDLKPASPPGWTS